MIELAEIHRQVALSVKAGLVTTNDLLRVELRRQEVASNRLKVENGLKVSKMLLAQHIGADWHTFDIAVAAFGEPEAPASFYVPVDEALDRRAEYLLSEKNVEALLRTYVQHSANAHFIFAGSQRHTMGNMFASASRPFYQSVSMMHLSSIDLDKYRDFAYRHFEQTGKEIESSVVRAIYEQFDGITWYIQKMLNMLYSMTPQGGVCTEAMINEALHSILDSMHYTYSETLFRMPERQKEILIAISKEGEAKSVTSGAFIKKYSLSSSSTVQAAVKGLLEKDFITFEEGVYRTYDKFFCIWLKENY